MVINPNRGHFLSMRRFIAIVVEYRIMSMEGSSSTILRLSALAPSSITLEKQTERSYGVVGTFLIRVFPPKLSTRSVNVPPTSISMEFIERPRDAAHE